MMSNMQLLTSVFKNLANDGSKKYYDKINPNKKLTVIIEELKNLRSTIKGDKIHDCNLAKMRLNLKKQIEEFDASKQENNLSELEEEKLKSMDFYIETLHLNIEIQSLINRIAHKINTEEYNKNIEALTENQSNIEKSIKNYADSSATLKKGLEESGKLKEDVLTISSLVFSGFTLIQLNFLAFGQSNEYSIIDRLILFAGINIFLLLALYTIFSLIRNIISKETNFDFKLKCRVGAPIIILGLFLFLLYKNRFFYENLNNQKFKEHKVKYEQLVNTEILNIKKLEDLNEKNQQKFKTLEIDIKNLKYENYKKELDIARLKGNIQNLEHYIKDINMERSNINIGIKNTSKSKSLILKSE